MVKLERITPPGGRSRSRQHRHASCGPDRLDPATTTAYRLLAQVDLMRGHIDLALGQTDRALEINLTEAESYAMRANTRTSLLLGMAYYLLDRDGEAVKTLDRAPRQQPRTQRPGVYPSVSCGCVR
jgi:tetratricopeptide (TPR) repeat protein